jgi:hypothetical protein
MSVCSLGVGHPAFGDEVSSPGGHLLKKRGRALAFAMSALIVALAPVAARADVTKDQCVAANGKGQDLRRLGKLTAARVQLRQCTDPGCPAMVRDDCTKRLDDLEKAQPTIAFEVKDASGTDVSAVKVTVDGTPLVEKLDGTAIPVDIGEHVFTLEVAGRPPVTRTLVLTEGEKGRRERIVIGATTTAPLAPAQVLVPAANTAAGAAPSFSETAPPAAPAGSASTPAAADQRTPTEGGAQRTFGLVSGGIGVAGLVAGGIFGALSLSAHSAYEQNCGTNAGAPPGQCTLAGVNGEKDAATKGTISTALFVGAGVALGAGTVLFLSAPKGSGGMQVGLGPGGVLVDGRF